MLRVLSSVIALLELGGLLSSVSAQTWLSPQQVGKFYVDSWNAVDSEVLCLSGQRLTQDTDRPYRLFRSEDGGASWSHITTGPWDLLPKFQSFVDRQAIYLQLLIFGDSAVGRSLDGGKTWTRYGSYINRNSRWMTMFDRQHGILDDDQGSCYFTSDSGRTFTDRRTGQAYYLYLGVPTTRFLFDWADTNVWYDAVTSYQIESGQLPVARTVDGGRTWQNIMVDDTATGSLNFRQIHAIRHTGIVFTLSYRNGESTIYRSVDSGASWKVYASYDGQIKDVAPISADEVWAVANASTGKDSLRTQMILHSRQIGSDWEVDSSALRGYQALSIVFSDARHGWAVVTQGDTVVFVSRYTPPVGRVLESAESRQSISVAPNPSSASFRVRIPEIDDISFIRCTDDAGRLIPITRKSTGEYSIGNAPPGIYYIDVSTRLGKRYSARVTRLAPN